jgi:hypothetical protein
MIDLLTVPQLLRERMEAQRKQRPPRATCRGTPIEVVERNRQIRARYDEIRSLRGVAREFDLSHECIRKVLAKTAAKA